MTHNGGRIIRSTYLGLIGFTISIAWLWASCVPIGPNDNTNQSDTVVFGYNELGMHCMNQDYSELMLLPPYNNLRAQVIDRSGGNPRIVTSGITVEYALPSHTASSDKTNFWDFAQPLLGVTLAPNIGLTGNGLSGTMSLTGENDWVATGIPVTPLDDSGNLDPYALATITVKSGNTILVSNDNAIVPVSWEIRCDLCHNTPGVSTYTDILQAHDRLHGTTLEMEKPVLCASCHADPALGANGISGVPALSHSMHSSHAPHMAVVTIGNACYACHPGDQTKCLRDIHFAKGMTCVDCHTSMEAVGDTSRRPWVDEPRCGTCHNVPGHEYEQANTLYRMSKGHGNVHCVACHGSPHAITPTVTARDNLQAEALQGHAGVINTCSVCHKSNPDEGFFHRAGSESD